MRTRVDGNEDIFCLQEVLAAYLCAVCPALDGVVASGFEVVVEERDEGVGSTLNV